MYVPTVILTVGVALLIVNEKLPVDTPPQPDPINIAFTVYEPTLVGAVEFGPYTIETPV